MRPAYHGSDKPFVLALFSETDRAIVLPVLEELDARGYALFGFEKDATPDLGRRASSVVAFTSPSFAADEPLHDVLLAADAASVPVIPIQLEEAQLPDLLASRLMATNAIIADRYATPAELVDRLVSAESLTAQTASKAQVSTQKRRTGLLVALAAVVVAAIGLFAYNALQANASPDAEIRRMAEETYGMTAEDLEEIRDVVVVGEHLVWLTPDKLAETDFDGYPTCFDYASHGEDQDEDGVGTQHWYWNEDGSETTRTAYDLSFLTLLPNLERLSLANADLSSIPNLAGLEHLNRVVLYTDELPQDGLAFLEGSTVRSIEVSGCDVADYSPLSACLLLESAYLDGVGGEVIDIAGFAPPQLRHLTIEQASGDLADLAGCTQLEELQLYRCRDITNLGFLEDRTSLKSLTVEDGTALVDASALATCTNLRDLFINWSFDLRDFSFLDNLSRLEHLFVGSVPIQSFDFLANLTYKDGFDLGFAPSEPQQVDWSGLAAISNYSNLHVNPGTDAGGNYADIAPYIADATIGNLNLYECDDVDLASLPHVTDILVITQGNLTSLAGLDQPDAHELQLHNMQYLTSLDGIEGAPGIFGTSDGCKLEVYNCPRLADWSALEGTTLNRLELKYLYALPDLAPLNVQELRLEMIDGLADLSCLDALPATRLNSLELVGLDQVTSLVPAARLANSGHLAVPPQLADQAQALCEDGVFRTWEVVYPEGGWNPLENGIELISLDDLDVLPPALLGRVERLRLAGATIFDWSEGINYEWDDELDGMAAIDEATGEATPLGPGALTDLTRLGALTGLRELTLLGQPLTSLEGIQGLGQLETIQLNWCHDVEDFSALFACPSLREVELLGANVTSIQGIQNLTQLEEVVLSWNDDLTDLTPLLECPNLRHVRVSSTMEEALASIDGADYQFGLEVEEPWNPEGQEDES